MKRLLIIGCGDVAMRAIPWLTRHYRVFALIRNPAHREKLRTLGVMPIVGDLDNRASLARIAGLANAVLHFAPPENSGTCDTRTRHLLGALSQATQPERLVYISTSDVYGDCDGIRSTRKRRARNGGRMRKDKSAAGRNATGHAPVFFAYPGSMRQTGYH